MKFLSNLLFITGLLLFRQFASADTYIQKACELTEIKSQSKISFAGEKCLFLRNGQYASYSESDKTLNFRNKYGKVVWSKKIKNLQSLQLSYDEKSIYLLAEELDINLFCNAKADYIEKINTKDGRSLNKMTAASALSKLIFDQRAISLLLSLNDDEKTTEYNCSLIGFENITPYVYPADLKSSRQRAKKEVVLLYADHNYKMSFMLSDDFKKVIWHWPVDFENEKVIKIIPYFDDVYVMTERFDGKYKVQKVMFQSPKLIWDKTFELDKKYLVFKDFISVDQHGVIFALKNTENSKNYEYQIKHDGSSDARPLEANFLPEKIIEDHFIKNHKGNR